MTNTVRMDLCYRPLRLGWAVRRGDIGAIRTAVRYSHALWGGRFNPILVVDDIEEASQLVELFRLDMIWPLSDDPAITAFCARFPHLNRSRLWGDIFVRLPEHQSYSQLLDITNALSHGHAKLEWTAIKETGLQIYHWDEDDPLADLFLMSLGGYPAVDDVGIDFEAAVSHYANPTHMTLASGANIPLDVLNHHTLASVSRFGVSRHYGIRPGWDWPGFYIGTASDPVDLVTFWNLRAGDIRLWFLDLEHLPRYADVLPSLERGYREQMQGQFPPAREECIALWSRREQEVAKTPFAGSHVMWCHIRENFWEGGGVRPPMMQFGEASTLGVVDESKGTPRVSFALADKPFDGSAHFFQQHLVVSISTFGLTDDNQHTLRLPYVPELNEFCARTMHFRYDKLRLEPERIGLIVDAADHDSFLLAMPTAKLIKRLFEMAGFASDISNSGRIVQQLLTQLEGLQGARVFKIPGVRRLLRKYGPRESFARRSAIDLVVDKTAEKPNGSFSSHADLYLEPRPSSTALRPGDAFDFMVRKGLFRIGKDLECPKCGLSNWIALDALKQRVECELCGSAFDATQQLLKDAGWQFRRSGVLGGERHAQGAIPVALTLQQLDVNIDRPLSRSLFSASLDLRQREGIDQRHYEVDFVWLEVSDRDPFNRTSIILAECKDQGPIKPEDFKRDVENLRYVADAFPAHRFDVFVLLVKLVPFTPEEIATARTLNTQHRRRVILLTNEELEPYHLYEQLERREGQPIVCTGAQDLANITAQIYFTEPPPRDGLSVSTQ